MVLISSRVRYVDPREGTEEGSLGGTTRWVQNPFLLIPPTWVRHGVAVVAVGVHFEDDGAIIKSIIFGKFSGL
jgi:hypothetical protein